MTEKGLERTDKKKDGTEWNNDDNNNQNPAIEEYKKSREQLEKEKLQKEKDLEQIEKELNENFIIQKTKNLSKRAANIGEPGAVVDPLNPVKLDAKGKPMLDNNGKEIPNYVVYSQPVSSKVTSESSLSGLSADQIKLNDQKDLAIYLQKTTLPLFKSIDDSTALIKEINKYKLTN